MCVDCLIGLGSCVIVTIRGSYCTLSERFLGSSVEMTIRLRVFAAEH